MKGVEFGTLRVESMVGVFLLAIDMKREERKTKYSVECFVQVHVWLVI